MKTLFKKLILGFLLTGLFVLTSCDNNLTNVSVIGMNAIYHSIPSLTVTASKYTGNKITKYFKKSSVIKNGKNLSDKKVKKAGRNKNILPTSIGIAEGARLVSSSSR
jgi:ABC-type iron transport system FetAB permease component